MFPIRDTSRHKGYLNAGFWILQKRDIFDMTKTILWSLAATMNPLLLAEATSILREGGVIK